MPKINVTSYKRKRAKFRLNRKGPNTKLKVIPSLQKVRRILRNIIYGRAKLNFQHFINLG